MNEVSIFAAIACLFIAWLTTYAIASRTGMSAAPGRFASIDGLRGYLAFFVFLHHSSIWLGYLRTGEWKIPESRLFVHFGQTSVALFFMITAFLFTLKLIKAKSTQKLDWRKLYISRLLRLGPLYFFAVACVFILAGVLSNWTLVDPLPKIATQAFRWATFTALGAPNINGVDASIMIAKVSWSLPYEWSFYFMLPAIAMLMGMKVPRTVLALSFLSILCLAALPHNLYNFLSFTGGMLAAFLIRHEGLRKFADTTAASVVVVVCVVCVVTFFPDTYSIAPLLLLSVAFILIASGSGIFGILTNPISRVFGEVAYSIYLLHGIVLFVLFKFVAPDAGSGEHFWAYIVGITPLLVCLSFASFLVIERPAMNLNWRQRRPRRGETIGFLQTR